MEQVAGKRNTYSRILKEKSMEELISFYLLPTFEECYIVDKLKINENLRGFECEKATNDITYKIKVYMNAIEVYSNKNSKETLEFTHVVNEDNRISETAIDYIQSTIKLFKNEMLEYVERKNRWE